MSEQRLSQRHGSRTPPSPPAVNPTRIAISWEHPLAQAVVIQRPHLQPTRGAQYLPWQPEIPQNHPARPGLDDFLQMFLTARQDRRGE